MDYNYHRTTALLNLLIKRNIVTKKEFDEELVKVRKSEKDSMFIKREGKIK